MDFTSGDGVGKGRVWAFRNGKFDHPGSIRHPYRKLQRCDFCYFFGPQRRRTAHRWRPFSNRCKILDNASFSVLKPVLESPDPLLSNAVARCEFNSLQIDLEGKTYIESISASSTTLGGRHQVVMRRPASKIKKKSLSIFFSRKNRRNRFLWT